jgi:hypothetical protein
MRNRLFWALLAVSFSAVADVPAFVDQPGARIPGSEDQALGVLGDHPILPNVRAMAEALAANDTRPIVLTLPGEPAIKVIPHRFAPVSGFDFDSRGNLRVTPGVKTNQITFHLDAVAKGVEFSLYVYEGYATGSVRGSGFSYPYSSWVLTSSKDGRRVIRHIDSSKRPREFNEVLPPASSLRKSNVNNRKASNYKGGKVSILVVHTPAAIALKPRPAPTPEDPNPHPLKAWNAFIRGSVQDMSDSLSNSQAVRVALDLIEPSGAVSLETAAVEVDPMIMPVSDDRFLNYRQGLRLNGTIALLRDQYNADVVVMVVGDTGSCGIAYTQRPNCAFQDPDGI